jgi:hypothetical protein
MPPLSGRNFELFKVQKVRFENAASLSAELSSEAVSSGEIVTSRTQFLNLPFAMHQPSSQQLDGCFGLARNGSQAEPLSPKVSNLSVDDHLKM